MNNMNQMSLGEFYREIRLARKVKQSDVARGRLTASQLSKFELGQSMLSADRLYLAIEGINMTFAEFGHSLSHYQDRPFVVLGTQISDYHLAGDKEGLSQLLDTISGDSMYERLMSVVVKATLYSLDARLTVSPADINLVTTYLYDVESWTNFELYLFSIVADILDGLDVLYLGKFILKRSEFYSSIPMNQYRIRLALISIIFSLLDKGLLGHVDYFQKSLKGLMSYDNIFESILLEFSEKLHQYLNNTLTFEQVESYIAALAVLNNPQLTELLRVRLHHYRRHSEIIE